MKCIYCDFAESKVVDSRPVDDGTSIRRRRECLRCGKRFTTYEKVESLPVFVVKKDGKREAFDIEKIKKGVVKACEKREVSYDEIEMLINEIERIVYNSPKQEITSHEVGEIVMDGLRKLDEVAYVRFASVYRQFKDINTFKEELNKLLTEK
ncbi:transcriptional repressor NrdR [Christensenellaceae bacterium]|nr:transcriptional repressor NrdR [Christensenellaceae bacterium]BDF61182.1 transcriptional repressor NrdR [Christensenellaceae bacterium]